MDDTRHMLAEVFAQDDLVKRDFACWEANRQQRQQRQQDLEQCQAAHPTEQRAVRAWLAQSAGDAVHTTDFLDERNNGTQQPQPQAATMSDADSANWNSWFIEAFDRRMGRVLEFIGDEVRKMDKQQADDLAARIDQLEERLDLLEDRIAELEGGNGNARRVMTQPRLQFRRHGDAA